MAVFPVILVNSATGSDTAASGAGPSVAKTGTAASVGATATSVSITDAVDLSAVAVDGSACLYYADGTAGHRNFDQITAISGSSGAWTVTVANGFSTATGPFSWAIGGVRASIGSATSKKLVDNNGGNGDAMPGWTIQLASGHSETIAATLKCWRAGDTTNGRIVFQGDPAFATRPLLTFSNNGMAIQPSGNYWTFQHFELQNSNATKTASQGFFNTGTVPATCLFNDIKISNSTNNFWRGIQPNSTTWVIENCEIGYCADKGIYFASSSGACDYNFVHNCGGNGIHADGNVVCPVSIFGNISYANAGAGIYQAQTTTSTATSIVSANTCDSNGSDGITFTTAANTNFYNVFFCQNNICSNNGGYGINFSAAGMSDIANASRITAIRNNAEFNNTSGPFFPTTGLTHTGDQTIDPQYTNAAGGDFSIGTNLKAKGYPLAGSLHVGTGSSTYSYVDIGAAQRQEAGGGGTTIVPINRVQRYISRTPAPKSRIIPLPAAAAAAAPIIVRRPPPVVRREIVRQYRPVVIPTKTELIVTRPTLVR